MSSYTEIDTALLDLDFTNPRIQNYLQNYPEESRSGELLAMLLGTGTDSCASLKESIKEHGGIINPIIVNGVNQLVQDAIRNQQSQRYDQYSGESPG